MPVYYSEHHVFLHNYYDAGLKSLIEEMYYDNGRTPVSMVIVSYGGLISH